MTAGPVCLLVQLSTSPETLLRIFLPPLAGLLLSSLLGVHICVANRTLKAGSLAGPS